MSVYYKMPFRSSILAIICKLAFLCGMLYNLLLEPIWRDDDELNEGYNSPDAQPLLDNNHRPATKLWRFWTKQNTHHSNKKTNIHVYNFSSPIKFPRECNQTSFYKCIISKTTPSFPICVYPPKRDKYISAALLSDGIWEPYITPLFQHALDSYETATVIDIGANIGYYSLLSAEMGHQVVALEPSIDNLQHLHAAINRAPHLLTRINAFQNAALNSHRNVTLSTNPDNQGGIWVQPLPLQSTDGRHSSQPIISTILVDDLAPQIGRTESVIIKIDIEGFECQALAGMHHIIATRYIPYIFMEWGKMFKDRHKSQTPCPARKIKQLTDMLTSLDYLAYEVRTGFIMDPERSTEVWKIGDLYWRHKSAYELQEPY